MHLKRFVSRQCHSYQDLFTKPFDLSIEDFNGKRLLDIGCGPQGSLEWANQAIERVGLDPLVPSYRSLGIEKHSMAYVAARSEKIPFKDNRFDFVSCFNALDHVDHVELALREMVRVLRPGGRLLIIVDIGHRPTLSEPHNLSWSVLDAVCDRCAPLKMKRFEQLGSAAKSAMAGRELEDAGFYPAEGVLLAMLIKQPDSSSAG